MLTIKHLTVSLSGDPLFEDVSFVVHRNDRIGIVGPNGSGKSTLFKTILGRIEPDIGRIEHRQERIGHLPQDPEFGVHTTVEDFLGFHKNAERALGETGLSQLKPDSLLSNLSGGQKTRLALAKVLLSNPTILLLDEPTNHLDFEGLEWLEEFIKAFKGSVLIISHDRRLLDNTVSRIIEIDSVNKKVKKCAGGYTQYAIEREKNLQLQEDAYKRQQREKRRLELWLVLKKQEATVHPDPAKGKQIRAMEKRIQREIYDQELRRPRNFKEIKGLQLKGETANPKLILRCVDIKKSFNEEPLLKKISFEIRGKERVLLSGKNGTGKTTLLKIAMGDAQQDDGEVKVGEKVKIGYFAQKHEKLDPHKTVLEELESGLDHSLSKSPRAILGSFLFSDQSVFRKVGFLSSGERVRLIFAKLTHQENQLLVLDEPTNHLDIQSREVIEDALLEYQGAILAVSHDRYFIDKIGFQRALNLKDGRLQEIIL